MEAEKRFSKKLELLVAKYGKINQEFEVDPEIDLDELDYYTLYDLLSEDYNFFYKREKDEEYGINMDLGFSKVKSKNIYYVIFFNDNLVDSLRGIFDAPELYDDPPKLSTKYLKFAINDLRIKYQKDKYHTDDVKIFIDFTEELFEESYKKMDSMIEAGVIDFESLWYYLDRVNTVYKVKHFEEEICFRYKAFVLESSQKEAERLDLVGKILVPHKDSVMECEYIHTIKKFNGTKKLDQLKVDKLDEEEEKKFIGYGDQILNLYDKKVHMHISGTQYISDGKNVMSIEKDERVMVDYGGLEKYSNNPIEFYPIKGVDTENMKDSNKMIIFPFVNIYNLGINKTWGITHIRNLRDISYSSDAFDYLVLEDTKKSTVKCLINTHKKTSSYSDFIEGKGKGLVFLLYGPPGTGKTLTAEATCEYLKKPLYSINVGDLGTDPDKMEVILNQILDYAKRWDAIISIDEVDVFLEERETNMIIRNAMVCVFLKLLEYHDGIIFLTTNRLSSLDPAVKSRINLMMSYQELDQKSRRQIWESLFKKWDIKLSKKVIDSLSQHKLNGREIRNYIRLTFSILEDRQQEMTGKSILNVLEECFQITEEFTQKVKSNLYI